MLRLRHVAFACADPERVSRFWSELLDYERAPAGNGWIARDPRNKDVPLRFNRQPNSSTIEVPIHLDVSVPDHEAERERVLRLGGSLVEVRSFRIGDRSDTFTIMRDPEGNGFCLESLADTETCPCLDRDLRQRPAARACGLLGVGARMAGRRGLINRSSRSSGPPECASPTWTVRTYSKSPTAAGRAFTSIGARNHRPSSIRSTYTWSPMTVERRSTDSQRPAPLSWPPKGPTGLSRSCEIGAQPVLRRRGVDRPSCTVAVIASMLPVEVSPQPLRATSSTPAARRGAIASRG
jgi:predicted enzyme related to lactoylglutathione lyase